MTSLKASWDSWCRPFGSLAGQRDSVEAAKSKGNPTERCSGGLPNHPFDASLLDGVSASRPQRARVRPFRRKRFPAPSNVKSRQAAGAEGDPSARAPPGMPNRAGSRRRLVDAGAVPRRASVRWNFDAKRGGDRSGPVAGEGVELAGIWPRFASCWYPYGIRQ